jgi:hypothetical protein
MPAVAIETAASCTGDSEDFGLPTMSLSWLYYDDKKEISIIDGLDDDVSADLRDSDAHLHSSSASALPSPISVLGARPMERNSTNLSRGPKQSQPSLCNTTASSSSSFDKTDESVIVDTANTTCSSNATEISCSGMNEWTLSRWKELQEKRLALCRQRVNLERRLFESSIHQMHSDPSSQCLFEQPLKEYLIVQPNMKVFAVLWSGQSDEQGLPTGLGRMLFPTDGQVYEGHCLNGMRHGQGRNVWSRNGQLYTGEWVQGQREGRGTHSWTDGRTVTGGWKDGHIHGHIFFTWPDGSTYDGGAVNGKKQGRGTHTWRNGREYSGQYKEDYEHGQGVLTESYQNSKYRGQFRDGCRHGFGIQIWPSKTYEGEWYNNNVHGQGKLVWRNTGSCYTGQFRHGRFHGIGSFKEGTKQYEGQWRDGMKDGEGKATWADGRAYEGSFYRNKRHGYGRMVYSDLSLYIGGWKHGKRSGEGIQINANGIVQHCGIWVNDLPIDDPPKSKWVDKSIVRDDISLTTNEKISDNGNRSLDDSDSGVYFQVKSKSNVLHV